MANQNDIGVMEFVEACERASARTRWVILVMIVASVVGFTASWKAGTSGWIEGRLTLARDALMYFRVPENEKNILMSENPEKYSKVEKWIEARFINTESQIQAHVLYMEKVYTENVRLIRLPFFAITLDTNDLGVICGITFIIMMLVFRLNVGRELENYDEIFNHIATDTNREVLYKLLRMNQVLSTPPDSKGKQSLFWLIIPKLLYILPLLVQFFIIYNDLTTLPQGMLISASSTILVMIISVSCFVLLLVLTVQCVYRAIQLDQIWQAASLSIAGKQSDP